MEKSYFITILVAVLLFFSGQFLPHLNANTLFREHYLGKYRPPYKRKVFIFFLGVKKSSI